MMKGIFSVRIEELIASACYKFIYSNRKHVLKGERILIRIVKRLEVSDSGEILRNSG